MPLSMHRAEEFPRSISPLETAYKLQETAACAALDWPEACDVWSVINEELAEAKTACDDPSVLAKRLALRAKENGCGGESPDYECIKTCLQESLGNLLFAVVDICRKLDIDPDIALAMANENFLGAFTQVQAKVEEEGRIMGLEEPSRIKALWMQARKDQRLARKITAFRDPAKAEDSSAGVSRAASVRINIG